MHPLLIYEVLGGKVLFVMFHIFQVNFYFISVEGHEEEAFAVLYYIMYL